MRWASTAMSDPVVPNPGASLNRPRARWLEASIRATAEAAEAISALFEQAGQGGVVIEPEIVLFFHSNPPITIGNLFWTGNFSSLHFLHS